MFQKLMWRYFRTFQFYISNIHEIYLYVNARSLEIVDFEKSHAKNFVCGFKVHINGLYV